MSDKIARRITLPKKNGEIEFPKIEEEFSNVEEKFSKKEEEELPKKEASKNKNVYNEEEATTETRVKQIIEDMESDIFDDQSRSEILNIVESLEPYRRQLLDHPLYDKITSKQFVAVFMETHVFCVWDFMCLLKRLQQAFTSTQSLWRPVGSPELRFMINSIVLGEECDVDEKGELFSHFEMYVSAMKQAGADPSTVLKVIEDIKSLPKTPASLDEMQYVASFNTLPPAVKNFVSTTLKYAFDKDAHKAAAAFTFGREDLICPMFLAIIRNMNVDKAEISKLIYYLERHVEVDGDDHGPLSLQLVAKVCGNDVDKWEDAKVAANEVLKARLDLFNYLSEKIEKVKLEYLENKKDSEKSFKSMVEEFKKKSIN